MRRRDRLVGPLGREVYTTMSVGGDGRRGRDLQPNLIVICDLFTRFSMDKDGGRALLTGNRCR